MITKIERWLAAIGLMSTLFLAGCGDHYVCKVTFGSSTCSQSGSGISGSNGSGGTTVNASKASSLVYYLSGGSIAAAGLSGTTLAPLSSYTAPTLTSGGPDNMAIVNKQFVYVPMGDSTIQSFTINRTTGALTAIAGNPFTVSGSGTADGAWSDAKGKFLFVGSEGVGSIWVFAINSTTGALTEVSGSPFTSPNLSAADIMTVDASGQFLYVGQVYATSGVEAFRIDQTTGALTEISGGPFLLNVAQLRASPAAEFLLGTQEIQDAGSSATDTHLYVFSIDTTTGVPTPVAGSPFLTSAAPFDIAIAPKGNFVFTVGTDQTTKNTGPIEGFQMNTTTGALTSLGAPFTSLPTATTCQFEQTGADLYCLSGGTNIVVLGVSSSTGSLANIASTAASALAFAVTD